MKVFREWRISGDTEWLRRSGPRSNAVSITASRPGTPTTTAWSRTAPQHLRHRVLGAGRHVHQLLSRRAASRRHHGPGAGRRRRFTPNCSPAAVLASNRSCSMANTSSSGSNGKDCARGIRSRSQRAQQAIIRPKPSLSLKRKGRIPIRHRLPFRRRARCLDGAGLRRWTGRSIPQNRPAICARSHQYNFKHDLSDLRQSAAPLLRLRSRGRLAFLHLAQGRRAFPALGLFQRGLDRHRIPGRLPPDVAWAWSRKAWNCPRLPRPLRWPRAQSLQRISNAAIGTPAPCPPTPCFRT